MRSIFFKKPDAVELRQKTSGWRQVWVWLPVLVAGMVIAIESTDTFSAANTSSWLRPIFERVFGRFTNHDWGLVNHSLRKTGHFCGYGLVCVTFLRAWLLEMGRIGELGRRAWRWRSSLLAIGSTAGIASLDEWHQSFLPSRTGTPWDVLLDTCGATVSCGLVWALVWQRMRSRSR